MENQDTSLTYINKLFRYMKNDMSVETFMQKFQINNAELNGIMELCKLYGKDITIVPQGDTLVFKKNSARIPTTSKLSIDDERLVHSEICVVSDTHFGNIHNQLHLLNDVYQEAYNRGITTVLHVGDVVDGNYPNRPENPRQQFLHGFDEQAGYVADMYPEIDGMTTYYILGSHDETHYKNGQATLNNWLARCRKDMVFLGQDTGEIMIDKVKVVLDHPGGGSAQSVSYKPQKRIEILESHLKPKILLIGHYHKSYAFSYRNVQCVEVPALCDKTQFQQKQGLSNALGAYFLDIYSDKDGNIQYFEPEEVLYGKEDIWDEPGKDKKKVKKLEIRNGRY
jgi:predicted phosphodiesterase